ncbi:MAG: acyltransferase family protein [Chitinophagales bacterium]
MSDSPVALKPSSNRLASLDALRGFAMLWIIGARDIVRGLDALGLPWTGALANQLAHAGWNGFTFYDLVFPLFLFIVGVSLVFSLRKRRKSGQSTGQILLHAGKRALLLFVLGVIYNGGVSASPLLSNLRLMGVLQRIALVYFFTSLIVLCGGPKRQMVTAGAILVGYWAMLRFVPAPGVAAGSLTPSANLAQYIDQHLLPGRLYWDGWDPEGLLSTIPAVATGLLGALAGQWLHTEVWPFGRAKGQALTPARKAWFLVVVGIAGAAAGLLLSLLLPINKSLWTSTYALLAGGLSSALLGVFYWLIDVRGIRRWAFPFVVIGMNSLFIYLAVNLVPFDDLARRLAGGDISALFGKGQVLFESVVTLFVEWGFLYWLYRRKIFVKL